MSQRIVTILRTALKAGLLLLPLLSLIIAGNNFGKVLLPGIGDLFFPFITGKNFFFRMIVEALFALWIFLALADRNYRPQRSPVLWALAATISALTLSTIFAIDPSRAFWSNFERMEGLIGHLHLFAYVLMLASVFRKERDWKLLFSSAIGVSAIMTLYGYLQLSGAVEISQQSGVRLDGTFGNATYLAIFILFHVFLLGYVFLREQKRWVRAVFLTLLVAEVPIIFLTATRGAIMGVLVGGFLFALLAGILQKRRNVRYAAYGIIAGMLLLFAVFLSVQDSAFVKNNYVLGRFSNLSLKERTIESRFTIWGMALRGLKDRPVLGYGPENFSFVFNKYYEPKLWRQEPWFDRAHNIVFDWLSSGGILGFAAYFSIYAAALYMLWSRYRKNPEQGRIRALAEPAAFTALFAAYLFHNFFVFDNISSYFLFFSVLGFIHYRYVTGNGQQGNVRAQSQATQTSQIQVPVRMAFATVAAILMVVIFYFVNVKPLLAARALLDTLRDISIQGRNTELILSDFDKVFSYRTFGTQEAREQLTGYANNVTASDLPNDAKVRVLSSAITEMERQVAEKPKDTRGFLFLAALYDRMGRSDDALAAAEKALALSQKKQQIFSVIADVYLRRGELTAAQEVLQKSYDLDRQSEFGAKALAIVAILNRQEQYAEELLNRNFGTTTLSDPQLVSAYAQIGNYERVKELWLKFIEVYPPNAQYHMNLAGAYLRLGNRGAAVRELQRAVEINPGFRQQGETFIQEILRGGS